MSDTPRTDKHVADIGADGLADGDFARSLERDLTASQERVERLESLIRRWSNINYPQQEIRAEVNKWKT